MAARRRIPGPILQGQCIYLPNFFCQPTDLHLFDALKADLARRLCLICFSFEEGRGLWCSAVPCEWKLGSKNAQNTMKPSISLKTEPVNESEGGWDGELEQAPEARGPRLLCHLQGCRGQGAALRVSAFVFAHFQFIIQLQFLAQLKHIFQLRGRHPETQKSYPTEVQKFSTCFCLGSNKTFFRCSSRDHSSL